MPTLVILMIVFRSISVSYSVEFSILNKTADEVIIADVILAASSGGTPGEAMFFPNGEFDTTTDFYLAAYADLRELLLLGVDFFQVTNGFNLGFQDGLNELDLYIPTSGNQQAVVANATTVVSVTAETNAIIVNGTISGRVIIEASPSTDSYSLVLPASNGVGFLYNDGNGITSFVTAVSAPADTPTPVPPTPTATPVTPTPVGGVGSVRNWIGNYVFSHEGKSHTDQFMYIGKVKDDHTVGFALPYSGKILSLSFVTKKENTTQPLRLYIFDNIVDDSYVNTPTPVATLNPTSYSNSGYVNFPQSLPTLKPGDIIRVQTGDEDPVPFEHSIVEIYVEHNR